MLMEVLWDTAIGLGVLNTKGTVSRVMQCDAMLGPSTFEHLQAATEAQIVKLVGSGQEGPQVKGLFAERLMHQ
eukprot:445983-Pelagomonas_calceolata.AAC.3